MRGYSRRSPLQTALLTGALILVPVATLTAVGAAAINHMNAPKFDEETACWQSFDHPHKTVAFVDTSAFMTRAQISDIKTVLREGFEELPPNGLFSIVTNEGNKYSSVFKPRFQKCRPPSAPNELSDLRSASKSAPSRPPQWLTRRTSDAARSLEADIEAILAGRDQNESRAVESPLIEMVQTISRADEFDGDGRTLIYISDGIQNTADIARFCRVKGDLPAFSRFETREGYQRFKPDSLQGAHVRLILLQNPIVTNGAYPHCSDRELEAFWVALMKANGASASLQWLRLGGNYPAPMDADGDTQGGG